MKIYKYFPDLSWGRRRRDAIIKQPRIIKRAFRGGGKNPGSPRRRELL